MLKIMLRTHNTYIQTYITHTHITRKVYHQVCVTYRYAYLQKTIEIFSDQVERTNVLNFLLNFNFFKCNY